MVYFKDIGLKLFKNSSLDELLGFFFQFTLLEFCRFIYKILKCIKKELYFLSSLKILYYHIENIDCF